MATSTRGSILWLLASLLASCVFPTIGGLPVAYVAAPLVMLCYNGSLALCLWASLASGVLLDAIELTPRLGFLGLSYLLSCRMLYPLRLYFFKDSIITLPIMTFLFSFLAGCIEILVALFFDISIPKMHWEHLLLLPVVDAFVAVSVFMLPSFLWDQYRVRRARRRYSDDT